MNWAVPSAQPQVPSFVGYPALWRGAVITDWPRHAKRGHQPALPGVENVTFHLNSGWGLMKKRDEFLAVSRKISFPDDFFSSPPKVN